MKWRSCIKCGSQVFIAGYFCHICSPYYIPTKAEITAACKQIRESWSTEERMRRRAVNRFDFEFTQGE